MLSNSFRFRLAAVAAGALLAQITLGGRAALAQDNSSLVDDRPVAIVRKEKPNRRPRRPRRSPVRARQVVERVPLLRLQWRVLKVREDGTQEETNPSAIFHVGDRLRLAVRPNQDGYLYVIHQTAPNQPGQIVFPDSRVNGGRNDVERAQEFILPSNCPPGIKPQDCSLIVAPPAGQEIFTLVFSRDLILDLPASAADAAGGISPLILLKLREGSGKMLRRTRGNSPFAVLVINTDTKDNEEIFETLVLNKGM